MAVFTDTPNWNVSALGFRDVSTDAQGKFSAKPLRPDKYLVVALDAAGVLGPIDASAFAKLASIATPVEVLENEIREISLTIAKLPQ